MRQNETMMRLAGSGCSHVIPFRQSDLGEAKMRPRNTYSKVISASSWSHLGLVSRRIRNDLPISTLSLNWHSSSASDLDVLISLSCQSHLDQRQKNCVKGGRDEAGDEVKMRRVSSTSDTSQLSRMYHRFLTSCCYIYWHITILPNNCS